MPYRVLLEIDGRPSLTVDLVYNDVEDTVFLPTATLAVRAIPEVVAADPGILIERAFGAWSAASPTTKTALAGVGNSTSQEGP